MTSNKNKGLHFFVKSNHLQRFCEGIQAFCPNFHRFCPDFHQIKSLGGALASLAPLPPTQVSLSVKGASKRMS